MITALAPGMAVAIACVACGRQEWSHSPGSGVAGQRTVSIRAGP